MSKFEGLVGYIESIGKANSPKVVLSTAPFDMEDFDQIIEQLKQCTKPVTQFWFEGELFDMTLEGEKERLDRFIANRNR